MGQNSSNAATRDAPTKFREEECASGTGQKPNDATSKDVQNKLGM